MELLDVKDRKLLYYLSLDGRASQTKLSKQVGLSKNAIKYRIERLINKGIITKFASVINIGSLNLDTFTLLLKFNEDIYENKDIIEYFRNHEYADWVVTLSGEWDIFAEFIYQDLGHMDKIIHEIIQKFGSLLNTYQMYSSMHPLRVEHLIAEFYKDLKLEPLMRKEKIMKKYEIDINDRRILNLLNEDSSLSYLAIAQKLNLTLDIVRYRIRNLIDNGIIIRFFPEVSLPKLGYTEYLYKIRLKNVSQEKMDSIKKIIKSDENITYAFFDITGFNMIFACAFKTPEGIDHLSRNLRKKYAEIIDEQEHYIIKEQITFNLFPKGLLKP